MEEGGGGKVAVRRRSRKKIERKRTQKKWPPQSKSGGTKAEQKQAGSRAGTHCASRGSSTSVAWVVAGVLRRRLVARPAREGRRWTDPFVGGDADPGHGATTPPGGSRARIRRPGGGKRLHHPPVGVAARRPDEGDAPRRDRASRLPPPHTLGVSCPDGWIHQHRANTPCPPRTTPPSRPVGDRSSNTVDPGNSRACRFHDGGGHGCKKHTYEARRCLK